MKRSYATSGVRGRVAKALPTSLLALLITCGGCASPFEPRGADLDAQDDAITLRVKTALIEEPGLAGSAIDIDFRDGEATLTGFVETEAERRTALRIVTRQEGVTAVVDELVIK